MAMTAVMAVGQTAFLHEDMGARLSPTMINYQGYVTDASGNPIENPSLSMIFTIYNAATNGTSKWTETQTVAVSKGIFNVQLGSITPIPDTVFTKGTGRWLELTIGGQVMAPRTRITAAGYAYTATYSDTAEYAKNVAFANLDARYVNVQGPDSMYAASTSPTFKVNATSSGAGLVVNRAASLSTDPAINAVNLGSGAGIRGEGSANDIGSAGVSGRHANGRPAVYGCYGTSYSSSPNIEAGVAGFSGTGPAFYAKEGSSVGLSVDSTAGRGVYIRHALSDGVMVGTTNGAGVRIDSTVGSGVYVDRANVYGIQIYDAEYSGVRVESTHTSTSSAYYVQRAAGNGFRGYRIVGDGFSADSAGENGLYVGTTGRSGVYVNDADSFGLKITNADDDAITIGQGDYGVYVDSARYDGMWLYHVADDGVSVSQAGGDGFYVTNAGSRGLYVGTTGSHGVYVYNAAGNGVYANSNDLRGGYFRNANNDYYALTAWNTTGTGGTVNGLYVQGHGYASGGWQTFLGEGKTGFSMTSPDMEIVISGSSSLTNGHALIVFDRTYQNVLSHDIPLKVIITPTSECNGIFVTSKSSDGFEAKELLNGRSSAAFDWIAIGRAKGYEQAPYTEILKAEDAEVVTEEIQQPEIRAYQTGQTSSKAEPALIPD